MKAFANQLSTLCSHWLSVDRRRRNAVPKSQGYRARSQLWGAQPHRTVPGPSWSSGGKMATAPYRCAVAVMVSNSFSATSCRAYFWTHKVKREPTVPADSRPEDFTICRSQTCGEGTLQRQPWAGFPGRPMSEGINTSFFPSGNRKYLFLCCNGRFEACRGRRQSLVVSVGLRKPSRPNLIQLWLGLKDRGGPQIRRFQYQERNPQGSRGPTVCTLHMVLKSAQVHAVACLCLRSEVIKTAILEAAYRFL